MFSCLIAVPQSPLTTPDLLCVAAHARVTAALRCPAEVVVAPVFTHIPLVQQKLNSKIAVSAQNCWVKGNGAYTGEVR